MSIEQKASQYDAMLKDYFDMKAKYEDMLKLVHDWALIQHRIEDFARNYRK